ncbi:MAG TPA: hypothetical protein VGK73_36665 [Polyangiaceae bacterium]
MQGEPLFVIPTCRLRDVGETVEAYDRHFSERGHSVRMMVFDDSGPLLHDRYFSNLARVRTKNELFYVGPAEKAALQSFLAEKIGDHRLAPLVAELFRPSYGGNRNFTLLYSLGSFLISADDDMRPWALMAEDEELGANEVCRGKVVKLGHAPRERRSFDILGAFLDVLGRRAQKVPEAYAMGDLLVDTAMDLETNTTKGFVRDNALLLQTGDVAPDSIVKMAQTYRSGTNDIDALDFIDMFLEDQDQTSPDTIADVYVLGRFRPALTNQNWRMDCGVAGYDNQDGLPPFFPTRLRFEDYVYRLWIRRSGIVAAHVPAAQNHSRSPYLRNPPASEILNEEIANLLKRRILASVTELFELGIAFDYDGELEQEDSEIILEKMHRLRERTRRALEAAKNPQRKEELLRFLVTLEDAFFGYELDAFQHGMRRILKRSVSTIKSSLELWPTLLEISDQAARHGELPQRRIGVA